MEKLQITSNNHVRPLISFEDLPLTERADFDYIDDESRFEERLFKFRGSYFDSYEFERAGDDVKRLGYDGVQAQSFFDAIVLRYFDRDGHELDGVVVGHLTW